MVEAILWAQLSVFHSPSLGAANVAACGLTLPDLGAQLSSVHGASTLAS